MRALFVILLTLFAAASATLIAYRNPGYVLIAREPFVLETSVAVFLLIAAALFVLLYFSVRLLVRILRVPHSLARWRQTRRTRKAREAFLTGFTQLFNGEWLKAEQELVASLHATDSPLLGYLGAALAAHGQGDVDKRDSYLTRARAQNSSQALTTDIAQAQIQLLANQNEQALATLARVQAQHPYPQPAHVVRLLIEAQRRLQDWQSLAQLLPEARRRELLPESQLHSLERVTQQALLDLPLPAGTLTTLRQAWSAVPDDLRRHPDLIAVYARQLLHQNAADEAAQLLSNTLERIWDERLVSLYGELAATSAAAQFDTAQEWHARHGDSALLLLTLGRLARRNRFTERARGYLEKSLALADSAEAHAELGFLFEETGDSAQALQHCRQALELCRHLHSSSVSALAGPGSTMTNARDNNYH